MSGLHKQQQVMKEIYRQVQALQRRWTFRRAWKVQAQLLLQSMRQRDPEINARTTPPQDESINLCCVWAVEFYTPSHISNLVGKLRDAGWDEDHNSNPNGNPVNWLNGLRRFQSESSSIYLGLLLPPQAGPTLGIFSRTSALPTNIQYANAWMYSVTPSLICIVVCFAYDEQSSNMFERALRTDRHTYATRAGSTTKFHQPWQQKSNEIGNLRAGISSELLSWFSENLPGLFSSGLLDGNIPTCELVTFQKGNPFPSLSEANGQPPDYLALLGMSHGIEAWSSDNIPGLKFSVGKSRSNSLQHHSVLTADVNRLNEFARDVNSGDCRRDRVHAVDSMVWELVAIWAILPMLEGYTRHISRVRSSITLSNTSLRHAVRLLKSLGRHISYSVDIAAVTGELAIQAERQFAGHHSDGRFQPSNPKIHGESLSLRDYLSQVIGGQASWLHETDLAVRSHLTQYGTLIGATESVRVQKRVTFLTWVLVILAFVTLVSLLLPAITYFELHRFLVYLGELWP